MADSAATPQARAALAYAAAGLPVFPCKPTNDKARGSKAPLVPGETARGARDGGHWLASVDGEQVAAWWQRWPAALIGFPTGERSWADVIDLDPRESPLEEMVLALKTWCGGALSWVDPETGEVISPAVARTQSGGLHFYFRHHRGTQNRANLFGGFIKSGEALPALAHIDVRGEGGYVIAPPSVMENGARYSWVSRPLKDEAGRWVLPPMPPALRRVVLRERLPRGDARAAPVARRPWRGEPNVERFIEKSFEGILGDLRSAPVGERNHAIFHAALRLGQFVRGGVLCMGEAEGMILGNLPPGVSAGESKALKTMRNGLSSTETPAFDPKQLRARA